ncbi:hypothetical protein PO909_007631 [Leuciscus waleckii]
MQISFHANAKRLQGALGEKTLYVPVFSMRSPEDDVFEMRVSRLQNASRLASETSLKSSGRQAYGSRLAHFSSLGFMKPTTEPHKDINDPSLHTPLGDGGMLAEGHKARLCSAHRLKSGTFVRFLRVKEHYVPWTSLFQHPQCGRSIKTRDIGYRSDPAPTHLGYMILSCSTMKAGHCLAGLSTQSMFRLTYGI